MSKNNLFFNEIKRLENSQDYAVDRTYLVSDINARDRNLIEKVFIEMDHVAKQPEWEAYWIKQGLEKPTNYTPNQKFIYDDKEWTFGNPHKNVRLDLPTVNKFVSLALDLVKAEQTRKSKLLFAISPDNLRFLIEKFSAQGVF